VASIYYEGRESDIRTRSSVAKSKYAARRCHLAYFHKPDLLVRWFGANFIAELNILNLNMYDLQYGKE
jgi:hypothetical protein